MQKKLILVCMCFALVFSLIGCLSENKKSELEELYAIAQTDKDFAEFKQLYSDFNPVSFEKAPLKKSNYISNKQVMIGDNNFEVLTEFIDAEKLSEDTIIVFFTQEKSDVGLIAIIDFAKKESLLISSYLKVNVSGNDLGSKVI